MRTLHRAALVALLAAVPAAWAAEFNYDFVACTHSRRITVEASPEVQALGFEVWGVVASSTTKEWEGASTHCTGYMRVIGGKPVGKGVCKWVDAAGDSAIGEFEYPNAGAPTWTWLAGTGRLKGISGGGTFQQVVTGKPIDAGTSQLCRRDWGKYSLP